MATASSSRSVRRSLVEEGDREQAYEVAREAYLEHFEYVEIPLRLRDPNLVLDLEFKFAELRDGIEDGAPVARGRGHASSRFRAASTTSSARSPKRGSPPRCRLRLLVRDPLPGGPRGGAADRDPARLAGGGAGLRTTGGRSPGASRGGLRRDGGDLRARDDPARAGPRGPRDPRGGRRPARGGRPVHGHVLARLAPGAAPLDGVHALPRLGRGRHRRRGSRSPASASRRSTARASRPCSSTRRWSSTPRG